MIIEIKEYREKFEESVEAYGFWCEDEDIFTDENQYDPQIAADTTELCCSNCGEQGVCIPVKVVQRTE